jgi:hypothetical protein
MDETPSPRARRITRRIIEETGCNEIPEQELLELVHAETRELRSIPAYSQSLKLTLMRIINASHPHAELRAIAGSLGISIVE